MKTVLMSVEEIVNNEDICFSDSEGMIQDKFDMNVIGAIECDELFATMNTPQTKQRVLDWKLEECAPKFIESIERIGIRGPVAIMDNWVWNGHHRIAVAQHLGIKVPVNIYDDWDDFDNGYEWENGLIDCFGDREL